MKLLKPKAELLSQPDGLEGIYKQIEIAGRTCYKSESKIVDDSAKLFADRLIKSGHTAMLEHGTVYLYLEANPENTFKKFDYPLAHFTAPYNWSDVVGNIAARYSNNQYSKVIRKMSVSEIPEGYHRIVRKVYITTNYRVIVENGWQDDLQFICAPTDVHEKRHSFKLTTSIGVTRELNRSRRHSIAEQSTRYCNYSKGKFGGEVAFCIPSWVELPEGQVYWHDGICYRAGASDENPMDFVSIVPASFDGDEGKARQYSYWLGALDRAEEEYMLLLKEGWQPQQAREVLPLCTTTEIVHTAFASDWRHFFDLRLFGKTGNPHPNMLQLAKLMQAEAEKQGIWDDIMSKPSRFE